MSKIAFDLARRPRSCLAGTTALGGLVRCRLPRRRGV